MKTRYLTHLIELHNYAAIELSALLEKYGDVLSSGSADIGLKMTAKSGKVELSVHWKTVAETALELHDEYDPELEAMCIMPLRKDAGSREEIDAALVLLEGRAERARNLIAGDC